jgi:pimeloyl-ACP methyl ester carboxylesterase
MDYVRIKDVDIYHGMKGEGRPIIFLHGNPADHRSMVSAFEPIFEKRPGWQRIYLDLPGMGQTKGADWINRNDHVLELVMAFLETVIPGKRFLVVGESYGGYLSRGLAHYKSDMIDGMLLLSPAMNAPSDDRRLPGKSIIYTEHEYVQSLSPELQEMLGQVAVAHTREVGERLIRDYISAIQISDQPFLQRIRERYAFSFDLNDPPPRFEFPALVITGRQDNIVGYEDQLTLHENFLRGTVAVLDRSGHVGELEQPILFTTLVNEWLDRVEEYLLAKSEPA